jgi:pyridoxal 5'-phosphate synthase pdxS subunit
MNFKYGGVIMDVINAEQAKIAEALGAPHEILLAIKKNGRLPVTSYATPADAALMMELGADGVFVGSGIFKSENPEKFARAIVKATENFKDYKLIGELSKDIGEPMKGLEIGTLQEEELMSVRGW